MIRKAFIMGEVMKLCKSYRSTFEITDFAQKIQTNTGRHLQELFSGRDKVSG